MKNFLKSLYSCNICIYINVKVVLVPIYQCEAHKCTPLPPFLPVIKSTHSQSLEKLLTKISMIKSIEIKGTLINPETNTCNPDQPIRWLETYQDYKEGFGLACLHLLKVFKRDLTTSIHISHSAFIRPA